MGESLPRSRVQTSLRSICTYDLGQDSPIKTSCSVNKSWAWEILNRTSKSYQDPVLWRWLEFFLPKRYQFLHKLLIQIIWFSLQSNWLSALRFNHESLYFLLKIASFSRPVWMGSKTKQPIRFPIEFHKMKDKEPFCGKFCNYYAQFLLLFFSKQ